MNETTSTPDDPDGRGSVATGGQADAATEQGVAPATGPDAREENLFAPAGVDDAPAPQQALAPQQAPTGQQAPTPEQATAPSGAPATAAERRPDGPGATGDAVADRAQPGGRTPAGGGSSTFGPDDATRRQAPPPSERTGAAPVQRPGPPDSDTPTAEMRLPSNGSGPRPVAGAPGDVPVAAMPGGDDTGTRPSNRYGAPGSPPPSGASTRYPMPTSGPPPGPGPAAAPPPPWHRVQGQDTSDRSTRNDRPERSGRPVAAAVQERPAGGLLDDGPTTYLDPPARPVADDQMPAPEGGGWSGVQAVRNRPPRQAALQLKRLDPWSVLKLALVLAVVLFFIWLVAIGVLYGVLDGMGVWDRLNGTYADLVSGETPTGSSPLISAGRVFGLAAVIGAINSLLFAVAVTVGAFVYNVSADLVGGIEVTLSERD